MNRLCECGLPGIFIPGFRLSGVPTLIEGFALVRVEVIPFRLEKDSIAVFVQAVQAVVFAEYAFDSGQQLFGVDVLAVMAHKSLIGLFCNGGLYRANTDGRFAKQSNHLNKVNVGLFIAPRTHEQVTDLYAVSGLFDFGLFVLCLLNGFADEDTIRKAIEQADLTECQRNLLAFNTLRIFSDGFSVKVISRLLNIGFFVMVNILGYLLSLSYTLIITRGLNYGESTL